MSIRFILIHSLVALNLLTGLVATAQAIGNTLLGTNAGASLTSGANNNTLIGEAAGQLITNGDSNTLVGLEAGRVITGSSNTMVGKTAGWNTTTGPGNAFFGEAAGLNNMSGSYNTYLGRAAGRTNQTGHSNVFVGRSAGEFELGSNKLYIDSSSTSAPLIYGDFLENSVGINGALGVGTQIPMNALHVRDGNPRIEQTGPSHATLNFVANGQTWEIKNNQATGRLTFFSPGGGATTASFKFDRQAVENLLRVGVLAGNTVDINGNLMVTGTFSNPDYVFTPEYKLETIEDHAAYMLEYQHLPAVGAGQVNAQGQGMVNVGQRSQGMLEELEKAHIYIEQLHGEITQNGADMDALQVDRDHKEKQIAALTKEMTANKAELTALESKVNHKDDQLETLQGK